MWMTGVWPRLLFLKPPRREPHADRRLAVRGIRIMPTYPESPAPYISVVVAARNDDHGGNMIGRMQAFIDSWICQAKQYSLSSEIIVVEWNPPVDRARLMDELRWPPEMGACEVRFIEVTRE